MSASSESCAGSNGPVPEHSVALRNSPALDKLRSEDLIGFFGNVYWLLDGATIPDVVERHPSYDTIWFVRELSLELSRTVCKNAAAPLTELLESALSAVRPRFPELGRSGETPAFFPPCSTIVLMRLVGDRLEYLLLGDSYLLLSAGGHLEVHVDRRILEVADDLRREYADRIAMDAENPSEEQRRLQRRLVLEELSRRNIDSGYWIASDRPEAARRALQGSFSLNAHPVRVLAMSDGFAAAHTTFDLFDTWESLIEAVTETGFGNTFRRIRERELADPFGRAYRRPSRSDDVSALYLKIPQCPRRP